MRNPFSSHNPHFPCFYVTNSCKLFFAEKKESKNISCCFTDNAIIVCLVSDWKKVGNGSSYYKACTWSHCHCPLLSSVVTRLLTSAANHFVIASTNTFVLIQCVPLKQSLSSCFTPYLGHSKLSHQKPELLQKKKLLLCVMLT